MAELVAGQSTCCRMQVGAVLVKDNRVISIGFNGTPTGQEHCEDHFEALYQTAFVQEYPSFEEYRQSRTFYDAHGKWSIENELHAEQNAIIQAGQDRCKDATIYIWGHNFICILCKRFIVQSGIKNCVLKKDENSPIVRVSVEDLRKELEAQR